MRFQRKLVECNLTLHDDVIKHSLMQVTPISVKTAFSSHLELPVEQFATLADTIYKSSKRICNLYTADANKIIVQSAFNKK